MPADKRNQWISSAEEPKLFYAIERLSEITDINSSQCLIRVFPIPFFPDATLAILVGREDNPPDSRLNTSLQAFYAIILSTLSATLASMAEEIRENALGRMTHEFEVPLSAIRGAIQYIQKHKRACKLLDEDYPGDIWSWTELLSRLTENADVYRYIRKNTLQLDPKQVFLLKDVIAPAIRQVKMLLKERNYLPKSITYKGIDRLPRLWLDRNRFQQVMFNLLSNAIKYSFRDIRAFAVEIEGTEKGDQFFIFVRDWGPGIIPEDQDRIFEEEYRSKEAVKLNITGQCFGLWIVKHIIETHGGTIRVSKLFNPTEFEIMLPYWLTSKKPTEMNIS